MGAAAAVGGQFAEADRRIPPPPVGGAVNRRRSSAPAPPAKVRFYRLRIRPGVNVMRPSRPMMCLDRPPASGFSQPADQMPAGVPAGVQAALRFIDLHRNRPERQRRSGKVQHGIPCCCTGTRRLTSPRRTAGHRPAGGTAWRRALRRKRPPRPARSSTPAPALYIVTVVITSFGHHFLLGSKSHYIHVIIEG